MPSFGDLSSAAGLKQLNTHLETRSYITGFQASADDASTFASVSSNVDAAAYPHVSRWFNHIAFLIATNKLAKGKAGAATPAPAAAAPAAAKADADDSFSFDDDDEDDGAAATLIAKKKEEEEKKKEAAKKAAPVGRSTVVLDVSPSEAETDLDALEKAIRTTVVMEGLVWGASDRVPVAYGVKKIRILSTIVDDLVSVDDMQEQIEALDGCQSTTIFSYNKV